MADLNLKKQMPKNLIMNIVSFVCNVLIGLWLVPYLVKHLGKAAYGLIPLAMIFTEYVSIITQSLNSAINRFLAIALQKEDKNEAGEIFNTSLVVLAAFALIQLPLMAYIVYDLSFFVSIPEGIFVDACWLFGLTFAGFLLSLLRAVFAVSMFTSNRLDLLRMNDIARTLTRVFIIIALFSVNKPTLKYVGIANLGASFVVFLMAVYYWRKLTPELKIDLSKFRISRIKDLSSMGGWMLVNQVGYLLFLRVDIFIINRFLGAEAGGEYAVVMQWSVLIRSMGAVLSGVVAPVVMIYYAKGKLEEMVRMVKVAVKGVSVIMAVPLGMLCAYSHDLLALWLGEHFRNLGWLLVLQLFHLVVNVGVLPLFPINTALNKVRWPGIVTCLLGILNLVLAIVFIKYSNLGYYGIAAVGALVITLKNGLFTPVYASIILDLPKLIFLKNMLSSFVVFIAVASIGTFMKIWFVPTSLLMLILLFIFIAICSTPVVIFSFSRKERKALVSIIPINFKVLLEKVFFIK